MRLLSYWSLFDRAWTIYLPVFSIQPFRIAGWHRVTIGLWLRHSAEEFTQADTWASSGNKTNVYKSLGRVGTRLFVVQPGKPNDVICGQLKSYDSPREEYQALSYVWGDIYGKKSMILVDGIPFYVTTSLYSALRQLRSEVCTRTLWIDAICINQEDIQEKSEQVRRMSAIYKSATTVAIWLGEATEHSSIGMQVLEYFANTKAPSEQAPWRSLPPPLVRKGLRDILSREWFQRTWVVQEVALSRTATIMCGRHSLEWDSQHPTKVRRFMRMIKFAEVSPMWDQCGLGSLDMSPLLELLDLQIGQQLDKSWGGTNRTAPDVLDIMYDLRKRRSTDLRDKVFGVLGLVEDYWGGGDEVQIDYSWSLEQTYDHLGRSIRF